jgi:hypothetical protein
MLVSASPEEECLNEFRAFNVTKGMTGVVCAGGVGEREKKEVDRGEEEEEKAHSAVR